MTELVQKTKSQINWLTYWHIQRNVRHIPMRIAWKLPKKVLYWAVVRAAVMVEPNSNPADVTAHQMLEQIGDPQ